MIVGKFHVQLHFKDGSAQAFLTRGGIRRHTWNKVILTFDDIEITITVTHGEKMENEEIFEFNEYVNQTDYNLKQIQMTYREVGG